MIRLVVCFACCFSLVRIEASERIKLYCIVTPQFERLLTDYFLPSIQDDFEVVMRKLPEECPSGIFQSEGWGLVMLHKLEVLKEAIQENANGQVFIYSDVDIIFFKPVLQRCLELLGDLDFLVQQGWPQHALCAGFFVMRGNEKTYRLICEAESLLIKDRALNDQTAIRQVARLMRKEISWAFLPADEFPNGRRVLTDRIGYYSPSSTIALPRSIVLFHANCCIGLDLKIDFLKRVQQAWLTLEE